MLPLRRKFSPSRRKFISCVLKLRLGAFQRLPPLRCVMIRMKPEPRVVLPKAA
jgi:hypothetical protein